MELSTKRVAKYLLLPEVLPRVKMFFVSGFSTVAFYVAYAFALCRLIPAGHPYLNPANFGRFGVRHAVFEGYKHLELKREKADQIVIFLTIVIGLFLLLVQFVLFVLAFTMPVASAAAFGPWIGQFFVNPATNDDIAFVLLDRVFGVPGIYDSKVSAGIAYGGAGIGSDGAFPSLFHQGLQDMFRFYNQGLAIVAIIIILYFVIALVNETAVSGVPFGRRFNHAMAPVRIIIGLALIAPLAAHGYNGAQLLGLYSAKFGSNMATNAWNQFTTSLGATTPLGDPAQLVVRPNAQNLNSLVEFMFVALTCKWAYQLYYAPTVAVTPPYTPASPWLIRAYVAGSAGAYTPIGGATADNLTALVGAGPNFRSEIRIRFGEQNPAYANEVGSIKPYCGEIVYNMQDLDEPGARFIQEGMLASTTWTAPGETTPGGLIQYIWYDNTMNALARGMALSFLKLGDRNPGMPQIEAQTITDNLLYYQNFMTDPGNGLIPKAVQEQIANGKWLYNTGKYGWGGAGIWYNKIAQMNGSLVSATYNVPVAKKFPIIMEAVLEQKKMSNDIIFGPTRYSPYLSKGSKSGQPVSFGNEEDFAFAELFYNAQRVWQQEAVSKSDGSFFIGAIKMIFGLDGLFALRENDGVHPLAQLVGVGRSLIENSIAAFGYSFGSGVAGGIAGLLGFGPIGTVGKTASSFAMQVGMIGLSIGFLLFYILPFMPFLYFFLAVSNWVKTIFEAMVGLPLWALAHVRIDGEGIPGPAAMNGYYLLFEIFIRPILIIFGLLASLIIFAAQVNTLHDIWPLVTSSIGGFDVTKAATVAANEPGSLRFLRSEVDQFFYTIMYAIVVYMLALASFKLIDLIPAYILRWLGASVKVFSSGDGHVPEQMMSQMYQGSQTAVNQSGDVALSMFLTRNG